MLGQDGRQPMLGQDERQPMAASDRRGSTIAPRARETRAPSLAFVALACASIAYNAATFRAQYAADAEYAVALLVTEAVCLANVLVLRSVSLQGRLHDAFVFFVLFGNLSAASFEARAHAAAVTCCMLVTRHAYDRCIFQWWKTSRSRAPDVAALLVLALGQTVVVRWPPLTAAFAVVALLSHDSD